MPPKIRRALACNACRTRKIRCNGDFPCANCQDRAEECTVPLRRRSRRPRDSNFNDSEDITPQANETEIVPSKAVDNIPLVVPDQCVETSGRSIAVAAPHEDYAFRGLDVSKPSQNPLYQPQSRTAESQSLTFIHYQPDQRDPTPQQYLSVPQLGDGEDKDQEDSSVYATEALNLEYYGPRSFLTFCSRPAVDWITSRVRFPGFRHVAKSIITDVAKMLKLSCTPSAERTPDPSSEDAWRYVRAYFAEAPEQAFSIVDRSRFESRLRAHLGGTKSDDKAWYALRNIVFACGSRIALSKTASFSEASRCSWMYFENALSVYTEIVFLRGSFMIVQALILLAYYSEGVGKTSLQYMLCSVAMRFACSKGLHRHPARSWNISPEDVAHRNWIFWSIYCLEKQNCSRSGRPSVMDDDEISCQIPQNALSGKLGETTYCHILIDLMHLTSSAQKRLSSARALRKTPAELLEAVQTLQKELDEVRRSSERRGLSLDSSLDPSQITNSLTMCQAQSLQYHYVLLVMDINTPLAYPWSNVNAYARKEGATLAQIEVSVDAVARASRSAILATRQIQVNASCSSLIALYTPIYSFINLFICILRGAKQAQSDLVLLDIALGYFSTLSYATDFQLSVPFAKDLCKFARQAVDEFDRSGPVDDEVENAALIPPFDHQAWEALPLEGAYPFPSEEFDSLGWFLDEMDEPWNDLLPSATWEGSL